MDRIPAIDARSMMKSFEKEVDEMAVEQLARDIYTEKIELYSDDSDHGYDYEKTAHKAFIAARKFQNVLNLRKNDAAISLPATDKIYLEKPVPFKLKSRSRYRILFNDNVRGQDIDEIFGKHSMRSMIRSLNLLWEADLTEAEVIVLRARKDVECVVSLEELLKMQNTVSLLSSNEPSTCHIVYEYGLVNERMTTRVNMVFRKKEDAQEYLDGMLKKKDTVYGMVEAKFHEGT